MRARARKSPLFSRVCEWEGKDYGEPDPPRYASVGLDVMYGNIELNSLL